MRNELGKISFHVKFCAVSAAVGAVLAVATIPLHLLMSKMQSEQFAAEIFAVTAAIYIGFRLQKGNRAQIAAELAVATGFFAAAHP
ncbi:MAG: hypothetical protein DLM68_03220 [Hyphomicrobiales bacterium]|nr:MAG: hypothetical protein DLM68_03220 [Hyphomicrobiales bacterium]